ncbi:OPT oligopeptide transporter protein domain-containing protein [Trichoderma breve]|uniref:OPT oligopeptide transporter protein domain-containing protein n=1 Tax=Trichoderma breve TaxID=2034170 RepID=A0A9W9E615_9HYPO|nr:OPT oligopeptide transporter protein domain-containing protein [Trichoderma breve]KAJ4860373.1 OPT oligopeptide transporter protein domain-containing protein [Trichoderma breve]
MDNMAETSGRESESGLHPRHSLSGPTTGLMENLRENISKWPDSGARNDADDDDQGSEYELLMDPNLPEDHESRRHAHHEDGLSDDGSKKAEDEDDEENSPYPEVRAAVHNYDEDVPCNTVRAWTIGLSLVILGASMNTIFSLRRPAISIGALVAQIIAWPIGHGWARFVPEREFNIFGLKWQLNPGPFNMKEHAIIGILLTVSTQSLGYGIAGVMRKYLVYPASMIWPGNLASVAMMNAMYDEASFAYYFIPGFFAQFLSVFAFATWMAPQNPVINQLFGGNTGLSIIPITFDWSQVTGYIGSPLVTPWHAIANTLISVVIFYSGLTILLHYSGTWYAQFLPINDASIYDNTGARYNISRVVNPDMTLNEEAYHKYSPLFISTTFAISYGLSFAAISSLVVYTYLHHGKYIWKQYMNSTTEKPDIHMKLMRKYKEAPTWWYLSLFCIMLALGFYTVLAYPTNLTWWAFLLAVMISFGFSLPIGIIQAVTNNQIGLNVLTEFVYGYIQPGRPLALMLFKTFGYITMSQALNFVSDLKFGHYMKIPPRTMFMAQVVATTYSCVIQVLVLNLALNSIENVCDDQQEDHFTCPGGRVFYSASVIWGLIGPGRMFSPGQIYSGLFIFFILGAITPIIIYFAVKKYPKSPVRYLIAPLLFGGPGSIPPATPLNYFSWGIVGFVFQFWIKKRYFRWWSRLNFLTSSGLDLGLALATLFIFFAFTLNGIDPPKWWGNTVVDSTMDSKGTAIRAHVAAGEHFGPSSW